MPSDKVPKLPMCYSECIPKRYDLETNKVMADDRQEKSDFKVRGQHANGIIADDYQEISDELRMKLSELLAPVQGRGVMDLIWGPELEFKCPDDEDDQNPPNTTSSDS